jgi:hypothetical protein
MLLITIFMELRVVAGKAERWQIAHRPPQWLYCGLEKNSMVRAWHGYGMVSVNQTWLLCVNQMGKTHSKPLAAWHGKGTAWVRYAV